MIKKHWPVLFAILVVIISIILCIAASQSTDTGVVIAAGVISWMFLFPLAGALLGGWYGWKLRSPLKWFLAPAVYLGVVLYLLAGGLIVGADSMDLGAFLPIALFTGIACLAVEAVSSAIAWMARKNRRKTDQEEK